MKVIYISGPMTGQPGLNFTAFREAANELRTRGFVVINPADLEQPDKEWSACMRVDIAELLKADTIAVLEGWQKSRGARLEVHIARELGMEVVCAKSLEAIEEVTNVV